MDVLPGTGAILKTGEITKPDNASIGNIFAAQLSDWGGEFSASRLEEWAREVDGLLNDDNIFVINKELYVPFYGDVQVVAYNVIDWLLEEAPCYALTDNEIALITSLKINIRS